MNKARQLFRDNKALAVLTGLNLSVFIVFGIISAISVDATTDFINSLILSSDIGTLSARPWTVLSYSFANSSFMQLLCNMLCLYFFGRSRALNAKWLVPIYLAGALAGAIAFLTLCQFTATRPGATLIGSSAAVIAVASAVVTIEPKAKIYVPAAGRVSAAAMSGVAVTLFAIGLCAENAGGNLAHLGGFCAGLVFGLALKRNIRLNDDKSQYRRLVDKVKTHGYMSLSKAEKQHFFKLSGK